MRRLIINILFLLICVCGHAQQMLLTQSPLLTVASKQLVPEFVQRKYNAFSSTTFNFTLDATPIEGNLMVLTAGGGSISTPTFPAGYTVIDLSTGSIANYLGYKFAGAGESTSITITWSISQPGSMQYYEFRNIDTVTPRITSETVLNSFTTQTSQAYPTYNPPEPSVYIPNLIFTSSLAWSIDNGFQIQPTVSRFFSAYKIYSGPTNGEVTTWSGASGSGVYSMIAFRGKRQ